MDSINTKNWQISLSNPGEVVTDMDDIAQCVYIILTTIKGSDPLRPTFGSDVYRYIDRPMNKVEPMLVYEVYDAVERWEKRITVKRVRIKSVDLDKKAIEITGILSGSSEEIDLTFNMWEDVDRVYNAIGFGIDNLLGDKYGNVLILI